MNALMNLFRGIRSLFQKRRVNRELDEELAAFAEASAADKQRSGMPAEAALRAARIEIGSASAVKEKVWASRWESIPESLFQDMRFAIRQLVRSPGFSIIAVLSLALGIGANTAIFTLLNAILLRPLPVEKPEELLLFGDGRAQGSTLSVPDETTRLFSRSFLHDFRQKDTSFSDVAAVDSNQFGTKASVAGAPYQTVRVNLISGNYFSVLGVPAFLGRTIDESDDATDGAGPVAVAGYSWFQQHLNGDPSVLGKVIRIQSHDYTLVGVAKPGFQGFTVGQATDLYIPLAMEKAFSRPGGEALGDKLFQSLYVFGRLKPGATAAQANAETNLLFKQIMRSYLGTQPSRQHLDDLAHASVELTPGGHGVSRLRRFTSPLLILMTIVALVLLIACANIANMLLARGVARTREIAMRMALGASRRRIMVQLLTESSLLAVLGAAAGVALAWKASAMLLNMAAPGPDPVPLNLTPDLYVLAFTLGVTVFTALLFGTVPAFTAAGLEFTPALKDGRGSSSVSSRGVLARSLIVGQVALSVLLMVVAGLFVRSLIHLSDVKTGFDPHNVLVFTLDSSTANLPHSGAEEVQSVRLQQQIEDSVRAIPGVQSDSFSFISFNGGGWSDQVLFQGIPRTPANGKQVNFNITGDQYFSAMGIPLVEGRVFNSQDQQNSPKVAIINQTMARRFFPDTSAIGRRFGMGETPTNPAEFEVIGVVKDTKYYTLTEGSQMEAYIPCIQAPGFYGNFLVRYSPGANRQEIVSRVRRSIAETNPNILVNSVSTLEEQVGRSIATQSLIAQLSSFFGILAVFLACIGIYGLLSYSVARRTSELGIRAALGAQSGALRWLILRESIFLLGLGLAIGIPAALGSTRIFKSLLFELSPIDPTAVSIAIVCVTLMTLVAAWLPARRAARIDPSQALRAE